MGGDENVYSALRLLREKIRRGDEESVDLFISLLRAAAEDELGQSGTNFRVIGDMAACALMVGGPRVLSGICKRLLAEERDEWPDWMWLLHEIFVSAAFLGRDETCRRRGEATA